MALHSSGNADYTAGRPCLTLTRLCEQTQEQINTAKTLVKQALQQDL